MELLLEKQRWASDAGLSLAPPGAFSSRETSPGCSSGLDDLDVCLERSRKRESGGSEIEAAVQTFKKPKFIHNVELLRQPLPPGWEQCLDLQSGEMFYSNPSLRVKTRHDPRNGFSGPVPNDWTPSSESVLQNNNSYIRQLQTMKALLEQTQRLRVYACPYKQQRDSVSSNNEHHQLDLDLDLDLTLNLGLNKKPSKNAGDSADTSSAMVATACRNCMMSVILLDGSSTCPSCGAKIRVSEF